MLQLETGRETRWVLSVVLWMCLLVVRSEQSAVVVVASVPAAAEVKLTVILGLASGQKSAVVAQLATAAVVAELSVTAGIVMALVGVVVQAASGVVVGSAVTTAVVAAAAASFAVIVIRLQILVWSGNARLSGFLDWPWFQFEMELPEEFVEEY